LDSQRFEIERQLFLSGSFPLKVWVSIGCSAAGRLSPNICEWPKKLAIAELVLRQGSRITDLHFTERWHCRDHLPTLENPTRELSELTSESLWPQLVSLRVISSENELSLRLRAPKLRALRLQGATFSHAANLHLQVTKLRRLVLGPIPLYSPRAALCAYSRLFIDQWFMGRLSLARRLRTAGLPISQNC
jgi:hypothetical protein